MKRDLVTIIAITVIVLVCVFIAWPQLGLLVEEEDAGRAPARRRAVPEFEREPEVVAPLRFRLADSVTGEQVVGNALVRLTTPEGDFIDSERAWATREFVEFLHPPVDRPFKVYVRSLDYVDRHLGPFTLDAGEERTIAVDLVPLYDVTIRPQLPPHFRLLAVRVISTGPPEFPQKRPYMQWQTESGNGFLYRLPPGRYWLQVPQGNPRLHPDYPERESWLTFSRLDAAPGIPTLGHSYLQEFEVRDGDLTLEPEVTWPETPGRIAGRALDETGAPAPGLEILAIRCGPGSARELASSVYTDETGRFKIPDLPLGDYILQPHWIKLPRTPGAFVHATLSAEEPARDVEVIYDASVDHPYTEPPSILRARVTANGEPVAGARLRIHTPESDTKISGADPESVEMWSEEERTSEPSDANGEVEWRLELKGSVFISVPSHSPRLFRVELAPGRTLETGFELTWEGKGNAEVEIAFGVGMDEFELIGTRETATSARVHGKNPPAVLRLYGLDPGGYELRYRKGHHLEWTEKIKVHADETTTMGRSVPVRAVTVEWPVSSFGRNEASLSLLPAGESDWSDLRYEVIKDRYQTQMPASTTLPAVLSGETYRLILRRSGTMVAFAELRPEQDRIKPSDWNRTYPIPGASGGALVFRTNSRQRWDDETRVLISRGGIEPVMLGTLFPVHPGPHAQDDSEYKFVDSLRSIYPGRWRVQVVSTFYRALDTELEIRVGGSIELVLEKSDKASEPHDESESDEEDDEVGEGPPDGEGEQSEAHDRPLGGVKIKLPKPSAPPGPPPVPAQLPPEAPPPPSPLPPPPDHLEREPVGFEEFIYISGANHEELWRAVVHAQGAGRACSGTVLGYTWRARDYNPDYAFIPEVSLVQREGALMLWVRGVRDWYETLTVQVPGFEPVTIQVRDNHGRHDVVLE